jgi:hypothetical protein
MAALSLADFFAVYHNCRNRDLHRAVMRCAYGPERELLRQAAYAWQPETFFHRTLQRIMLADEPEHLPRGYITPTVTRVRKKLELWLRYYWLPQQSNDALKKAQVPRAWDRTVRQLFNSDEYSQTDIRNAVWCVMRKPAGIILLGQALHYWPDSPAMTPWERQLKTLIIEDSPKRPRPGNPHVYRPLAIKIATRLNKNLW